MSWPILSRRIAKGFVLPLTALLFTVLIAMVAFAVDFGYVTSTKAALRNAVDAANLAGASGLPISPAEARKRAKDIAAANIVDGKPLVLLDSDIELGTWDSSTRSFQTLASMDEGMATAVRITARLTKARGNPVKLIFAPLIGHASTDLVVSAVAGYGQAADVLIIQDITQSFSAELSDAKVGDQALVDVLYSGGSGRSCIGLVAHTGWGQTLSPLLDISSNYTSISNSISSLQLCGNTGMPVCSGTDIAAGLEEALKDFNDPDYHQTPGATQAVVLVSDGVPNTSSSGSHPSMSDAQLLQLAQTDADSIWAKGIHIFVVFFNRENDQTAAANLATLARGSGTFVQVADAKDLPTALQDVTRRLPKGLLK